MANAHTQTVADVARRGEAVGAAAADPAASLAPAPGSSQTPPSTNRGCLTPSDVGGPEVLFHLDYLKLTVFAEADSVLEMVESGLQERAGLRSGGWVDKGPADRWQHIYTGDGPTALLVPKDGRVTYTVVELKGEGCASCGAAALHGFLAYLNAREVRWHALRVDLAFDHVAFTPVQIDEANRTGNFNSRCLNVGDRSWHDSATGRTAYLGVKRQKPRRLRTYDKHGFVRFEAEFRQDWAKSVGRELSQAPVESWPAVAMGYVRGMVDYIDRTANARPERCPLLPWWAEFVGSVERIRNLPEEDRRKKDGEAKLLAIGKSEARIMRCARGLWPLLEAFGKDYVVQRIRHYAERRLTDEERAFVEELSRWRYSGLAGLPLPPDDEEVPF